METSTNTKVDIMKPVLLKAGIPLAITVAGFVFARLKARKDTILTSSYVDNQDNSPEGDAHQNEKLSGEGSSSVVESLDSSSSCCVEDNHSSTEENSYQNSDVTMLDHHKDELEEEILGLRNRLQDLQEWELELEVRYLRYNSLKEQELMLMELENKLLLETSKVDFLDREILMVEAEIKRFENMVFEYLKIMELLELSRSENRLLRRRVKKLLRKMKEQSCVIKEKCLHIKGSEEEMSRNYEKLEKRANVIRKMEEEIEKLKITVDRKHIENNDLLNQIELANDAASSKREAEKAKMAEFDTLVSKLEQLEKERADEVKELIYLRWCNACLRHELLRRNQEEQDHQAETEQMELHLGEIAHYGSDNELDCSSFGHHDSCLGFSTNRHAHAHSKRRKFIQKFKRWIEGSEKTKQKIGMHSAPNSVLDLHIPERRSFSST